MNLLNTDERLLGCCQVFIWITMATTWVAAKDFSLHEGGGIEWKSSLIQKVIEEFPLGSLLQQFHLVPIASSWKTIPEHIGLWEKSNIQTEALRKWTQHREAKHWSVYITFFVTYMRIKSLLCTGVQTMIICFKHRSFKGFIDSGKTSFFFFFERTSLMKELQPKLGYPRNLKHKQNPKKESESSVSKDKIFSPRHEACLFLKIKQNFGYKINW